MNESSDKKFTSAVQDKVQEQAKIVQDKARQGKKGVVKLVFGRTTVILLLVLLQILALAAAGLFLYRYVFYAYAAYSFIALVIVVAIFNLPGMPELKMPWIVLILIFPIMGGLFYLFVWSQLGTRILNRKVLDQMERTKKVQADDTDVYEQLKEKDPHMAGMAYYLKNQGFSAYVNRGLTYYPLGDEWFPAMLEALRSARKFIFMEYFIIERGEVWDQVLEILKEKAAAGVEVRLMYDGTVQFAALPHNYHKRLEEEGIKCKVFSPIKPVFSTYQNNRDHRKILVIDGELAFTGGTNLADEYINKKRRFGHWKDTALLVKGDAVRSFTIMFLQLWDLDGYENNYDDYLDIYPRISDALYDGYVIPYADSPLDGEHLGKFVYMHILQRAVTYVHIMTPYLIIDHEMLTALLDAVRRGVEVSIILPHIPDKKYAFALARTHYKELIAGGVRLYEYLPGFVHAKVFVSDDDTAAVGTINLDYRSLYLHFENGTLIYGADEVERIENDFTDTLEHCLEVTPEYIAGFTKKERLFGFVLKIVAPLM